MSWSAAGVTEAVDESLACGFAEAASAGTVPAAVSDKGLAAGSAGTVFSTGADVGDCRPLALNPTEPQDKTREKREQAAATTESARLHHTPRVEVGWLKKSPLGPFSEWSRVGVVLGQSEFSTDFPHFPPIGN